MTVLRIKLYSTSKITARGRSAFMIRMKKFANIRLSRDGREHKTGGDLGGNSLEFSTIPEIANAVFWLSSNNMLRLITLKICRLQRMMKSSLLGLADS